MPKKNSRSNFNKNKVLSKAQIARIATSAVLKKAETKMFPAEQSQDIGPDDTCYVFDSMDNCLQGTDNENRVGDEVLESGFQLRYTISNKSANPNPYLVRMMLIQAEKDEFIGTSSLFLTSTANSPLAPTANDLTDIIRSLNRKEFRVLFDKTHTVGASTAAGNGTPAFRYATKFFKLRGKRTWPIDSSSEAHNKNLRLVCLIRDANGATIAAGEDCHVEVYSRYYFKDL